MWHTYKLKLDEACRVLFYNIYPTTNTDINKEDLEAKNFQVGNIINGRHLATKTPLPLLFVDLESVP